MLGIEVNLLAGRYTATAFNDRDLAEWPPHPARLFSALVATWADADEPDPDEREILSWLEHQGAPEIACAPGYLRRSVTTHYVPVNDATALKRDVAMHYGKVEDARDAVAAASAGIETKSVVRAEKNLEKVLAKAIKAGAKASKADETESQSVIRNVLTILPENRGRQARTYPTVRVDRPEVVFSWPSVTPSAQQSSVLDGLLSRVARLGHSSTPVSCRIVENSGSEGLRRLVPGVGTERLRVPRGGLIDTLEAQYAIHQGEEPRTLPAALATYGEPAPHLPVPPSPTLGAEWIVLGLPPRSNLPLTRTLDITRAVRGALEKHGRQPAPEFVTGHGPGVAPTNPSSRPHLACIALGNVGNRHSDGIVRAVALVLPRYRSDDDRAAVDDALSRWRDEAGFELRIGSAVGGSAHRLNIHERGVEAVGDERIDDSLPALRTAHRSYWCRPSRAWLTVTPIALDRFPKGIDSEDPALKNEAFKLAEVTISRACRHAGLPMPDAVVVSLDPPLVGVPGLGGRKGKRGGRGAATYPYFKSGSSGQVRFSVHARILFREPVAGPVLLGAGRFQGYGLCLPAYPGSEV